MIDLDPPFHIREGRVGVMGCPAPVVNTGLTNTEALGENQVRCWILNGWSISGCGHTRTELLCLWVENEVEISPHMCSG